MQSDSPAQQRRWLILAHCFNMDGRAASQTITDRVPFLLAKWIQPVVVSAPTGTRDRRFPHAQVLSAAPSGILFETRHIIRNKIQSPLLRRLLKSLLTVVLLPWYLLEKIFIHLDSHWSWAISATVCGRRLARKFQPELIYSTAGPASTHLAGFFLHRITGLPWMAELHDPLCSTHQPRRGQRLRFQWWLEKMVASHAAVVIFFTEQAMQNAVQRHSDLATRAMVLRPGANPPPVSLGYKRSDRLHLGHFGSLAPDRNLKIVFEVLAGFLQNNPDRREQLRLHIYGSSLDPVSMAALAASRLEDVVVQHGRLEYEALTGKSGRQQILEAMRQSDALLLLHGEGPGTLEYVPSKLYEYLVVQRPILGLVAPGSELEHMLRASGHLVVAADDRAALTKILELLLHQWQTGGLPDHRSAVAFTVEAAAEQLIESADRIVRGKTLS